jgi:hypothetical protein
MSAAAHFNGLTDNVSHSGLMAPQSLQSHEIARRKIRSIMGKLPTAA